MRFLTGVHAFIFIWQIIRIHAVNWNGNNWALGCDFRGNDLASAQIRGEECGARCANTNGCTHWTWTGLNGGTCWMKSGRISKSAAFSTGDSGMSCGVIKETDSGDKSDSGSQPLKPGSSDRFPNCKVRFGTAYDSKSNFDIVDYVTIWIGYGGNFDDGYHGAMVRMCKEKQKIPVFYGYIIAFGARADWGLQDCDMPGVNLCQKGASYIREKRASIIERYSNYASNTARIMGRDAFVMYFIEPDFWQYHGQPMQERGGLSGNDMRVLFDDIARAVKAHLPNANFAWDISPWLSQDAMRTWWGHFASSPHIDYLFTSGGRTRADLLQIRPNELSWSFMSSLTGKRIIADTGYGVGGSGTGHDSAYDNIHNLRARINDGVIAVTQSEPRGDWGSILNGLRSSLPNLC